MEIGLCRALNLTMNTPSEFFIDERRHFFRPLTGKYREQAMACLRALYARLYSSLADYSRVVQRDLILGVFQETITRTPVLDASEEDAALPVRGDREQATWMLNLLLEYGWIERHVDEITLTSTYAFTRIGRLFTQPMHELGGGRFRTRHRNTRNTCNALRSFLDKPEHEASDLLDAYEYSERIVADFSDVIAELEERKRELIRDVEAQQLLQRASDEFFDFMEKRFMPDLAARFSEDSVIKYRDELDGLLRRARAQRRETKVRVERELRRLASELVVDAKQSVYIQVLDQIESRLHSAADTMLPALRNALHGFTRRADILLRQLSFSQASQHMLLDAFDELARQTPAEQEQALAAAAEHMAVLEMGFVDPDHIRLYNTERRRVVDRSVEVQSDDPAARRRLFIEQALERAFAVNNRQLYDYLVDALAGGHEVRTSTLPVRDARELLYAAHAIEVGASGWGMNASYRFEVQETGRRVSNEYYDGMDEFTIRVVEHLDHTPSQGIALELSK